MPVDWILFALLALVVLLLLLTLWLALRRTDHGPLTSLRIEIQADVQQFERGLRDEVARSAGGTRTELATTLAAFQQTLLTQQGSVARAQNEQIDSFRIQLAATQQHQADALQRFSQTLAEQLRALAQSNDLRLNEVRAMVEAKLSAIQADNEKKLEQVRATVD